MPFGDAFEQLGRHHQGAEPDDVAGYVTPRPECITGAPAGAILPVNADLFIYGRLLFAKLNMVWWICRSSIAVIDPDLAEVM
ncbi:hypothetical protein B6E78_02400 [Edwardsiella ictaluri]|nr:hypothetical protein B6E78_02400 [Edwardsiella ictaluri]